MMDTLIDFVVVVVLVISILLAWMYRGARKAK